MRGLKVLGLFAFALLCRKIETAVFDSCDHVFDVNPGLSYLESPYYPKTYPSNTSCRYKFKAPLNYSITVQCAIRLDKGVNACSTEYFYLARDGDVRLRGSEQLCGSGSLTRRSLFNIFTIAYISGGGTGIFRCSLNVQPQPCDCGWSVNTKIVNGEEAYPNEYPSLVALKERGSSLHLYCSGAIISHRYIITAAHCAYYQPDPILILVLVGRQNIQATTDTIYSDVYYVSSILIHPYYSTEPTHNDIALMKTTQDIAFKKGVGPICLPSLSNMDNDFVYDEVNVAGWGSTSFGAPISATLQKIQLLIVDMDTCKKTFTDENPIYPSHICTYDFNGRGRDSCQYDSGGPVILKHLSRQFIIGIISFGKPCGATRYPTAVNERITYHLPWILENTEYSTCHVNM